jgi:hypothetical protein
MGIRSVVDDMRPAIAILKSGERYSPQQLTTDSILNFERQREGRMIEDIRI